MRLETRKGTALPDGGLSGRAELSLHLLQHALDVQGQANRGRLVALAEFDQRRPKAAQRGLEPHGVTAPTVHAQQRNPAAVVVRSLAGQFRVQVNGSSELVFQASRRVQVR